MAIASRIDNQTMIYSYLSAQRWCKMIDSLAVDLAAVTTYSSARLIDNDIFMLNRRYVRHLIHYNTFVQRFRVYLNDNTRIAHALFITYEEVYCETNYISQ